MASPLVLAGFLQFVVVMANAPAPAAPTWWSDSSFSVSGSLGSQRPGHFAGPAPGAPRTPRPVQKVPVPIEAPADDRRRRTTALSPGRSYRRGAAAPEKSSLPFFVVIGLVVGLFAFGMMSFCLPDPFEKIAAREAAAAHAFPAPVFKTIEAEPVIETTPAVPTVAPAPVHATAAKPHVTRRAAKAKASSKAPALPSNPYAN